MSEMLELRLLAPPKFGVPIGGQRTDALNPSLLLRPTGPILLQSSSGYGESGRKHKNGYYYRRLDRSITVIRKQMKKLLNEVHGTLLNGYQPLGPGV
jgi:hypothetical protein